MADRQVTAAIQTAAEVANQVILEGLITTMNDDGKVNLSPMGPIVNSGMKQMILRPYQSSTTYRNLKRTGQGVFHVTDDVLLLARAAIHELDVMPVLQSAERIEGQVLSDCCRWYELKVMSLDDHEPRTRIHCDVVATGRIRDFFGFNRAKHAVIEAAILATRTEFLSTDEILAEYERLAILVEKTGDVDEHAALQRLEKFVRQIANGRNDRT